MTTTHLKQFLQQPYPGKAAFLRHVLEPLFGAENVHDTFDEPLLDRHPHLLSMARATGIFAPSPAWPTSTSASNRSTSSMWP